MQAQNTTNPKPTRQELKTAYALWETANATFYATDCNDELYDTADATAEAAWAAYGALCQRFWTEGVQHRAIVGKGVRA